MMYGFNHDSISHAPLSKRRVACFVMCLALLAVTGCVTETIKDRPKYDNSAFANPPPDPQPMPKPNRAPASPPASRPAVVVSSVNEDPCLNKIDELVVRLSSYYQIHLKLPETTDELLHVPGFTEITDVNCPLTGKPYVYTPQGVPGPVDEVKRQTGPTVKVSSLIILADAPPGHGGIRWAITIQQNDDPNKGVVWKVVPLLSK